MGEDEELMLTVREAIVAFANLSTEASLVEPLLLERVDDALLQLSALPGVRNEAEIVWRFNYTMYRLSLPAEHRRQLAEKMVRPLLAIARRGGEAARQCCAAALCNLSKEKATRKGMVADGAITTLVELSNEPNPLTQQWCAIALGNLSESATGL